MSKPKVAFFDFTCCEGCQLAVSELEERLLDVVGHVEIVNFREIADVRRDDYDIAFIEGSITRESEIPRLRKIRENARVLVALGACAVTGGVNAMKNRFPMEECRRVVYGEADNGADTIPARPVRAVVPVEYEIPGCPIDKEEFLSFLKAVLTGQAWSAPDYPMCVDCRLKENVCVFEKGRFCLGPVTRAGCGAICPTYGEGCEGCRGMVSSPRDGAETEVLKKYGLTVDEVLARFTMFGSYELEARKEKKGDA